MYIIERLFGVGLYSLILILICFWIKNTNIKHLKKILNIYLIILIAFSFFFIPPPGADLTRINIILELYKSYSFNQILAEMQMTSTPISNLIYWSIAKIGINGLISAFSSFVVFLNLFYIIKDYSIKNNIKNKNIAIVLFVLMASGFFMETISTIRDMIAYSIICRCFYDEFYNKKSIYKNILLYVISFLIHQSVIAFIGIRVLYYIFYEKKNNKIVKTFFLVLLISVFLSIMSKYIHMSTEKFNLYYNNESYSWLWEYVKGFLELLIIMIIVAKNRNITSNKNYIYNIILSIITLCLMKQYSIFIRFTFFNMFMSIPIMLETFEKSVKQKNKYLILLFSFSMLILACSRGDLSSLKFFALGG